MRSRGGTVLLLIIILAAIIATVLLVLGRTQSSAPSTPIPASTLQPTETVEAANTQPPTPTDSPTPVPPLVYTVQEGDTLLAIAQAYGITVEEIVEANGLADPNMLSIGQELIIPNVPAPPSPSEPSAEAPTEASDEPSPTAPPLPTAPPTPTPTGPPLVEIWQVLGSGDLMAEVVIVGNRGGVVSLEGWTLSDAEGNAYTFPALTIFTDAEVRVYSGMGDDTPRDLYWSLNAPAWNGGELITLRDATGSAVDTYIVP